VPGASRRAVREGRGLPNDIKHALAELADNANSRVRPSGFAEGVLSRIYWCKFSIAVVQKLDGYDRT